ncbi:MAG: hypothetical protein ACLRSW_13705 [Christensenellaceae bacterium]
MSRTVPATVAAGDFSYRGGFGEGEPASRPIGCYLGKKEKN